MPYNFTNTFPGNLELPGLGGQEVFKVTVCFFEKQIAEFISGKRKKYLRKAVSRYSKHLKVPKKVVCEVPKQTSFLELMKTSAFSDKFLLKDNKVRFSLKTAVNERGTWERSISNLLARLPKPCRSHELPVFTQLKP